MVRHLGGAHLSLQDVSVAVARLARRLDDGRRRDWVRLRMRPAVEEGFDVRKHLGALRRRPAGECAVCEREYQTTADCPSVWAG